MQINARSDVIREITEPDETSDNISETDVKVAPTDKNEQQELFLDDDDCSSEKLMDQNHHSIV